MVHKTFFVIILIYQIKIAAMSMNMKQCLYSNLLQSNNNEIIKRKTEQQCSVLSIIF